MGIIDPSDPSTLTSGALAADEAALNAALSAAGVTLARAQQAKNGFAGGVFNALRVQPISVVLSTGTYTFAASDEAVAALQAAATAQNALAQAFLLAFNDWIGPPVGAASGSPVTLSSALYGALNASTSSLPSADYAVPLLPTVTAPADFAALVTAINNWIAASLQAAVNMVAAATSFVGAPVPPITASVPSSVAPLLALVNAWINGPLTVLLEQLDVLAGAGGTPPSTPLISDPPSMAITWPPIGASAITLTSGDVAALFAALASRRQTLALVQAILQAAIVACTTVADVVAVSVSGASW